MKSRIKDYWKLLKEYNKIASIDEIGRRYFAMNSFDGILTILGILIGNYVVSVQNPRIILTTGFAASIAMGVSGIWGTYLTEEAERKKKMKALARATLNKNLSNTKIGKAEKFAILIISFINGLSPFLSASVVLSPFLFVSIIGIEWAYIFSLIVTFIVLMLLGGFLGRISKENTLLWGFKMVLSGIICVALIMLLGIR